MKEVARTWNANMRRVIHPNKHFEYPGWQKFPFQDERKIVLDSLELSSRRKSNNQKNLN